MNKKPGLNLKNKDLLWSALAGFIIGLAVAWLNPGPHPLRALLIAFALSALAWRLILWASRRLPAGRRHEGHGAFQTRQAQEGAPTTLKTVRLTALLTFGVRLLIGILLFVSLPQFGYDEAPPNNGYLYLDAYERDTDAWELASSGQSLAAAFRDEFTTDQYGGLLSLSAGIYRLLSPDAHRPLLILIITAFACAFGLPFLWSAIRDRWGEKTANASAWIYALYPESIILGASQMREPILIGLSAIAFWGVVKWREDKKVYTAALLISGLLMAFISVKAAAAIGLSLAVWFWIRYLLPGLKKNWRLVSYTLPGLLLLIGLFLSWDWLVDSSKWDLLLMEGSSGRIQWEVELIGERFRTPFIVGYGLAQPVLPAAIIYPGLPITRAIAIFRALGWYVLAPLLLSGALLVQKSRPKEGRKILVAFFIIILLWTIVSSARAGGDQWDNPRYRAILLVWMVFLGGWSWTETLRRRSAWLWRLLLLEIVYIGFFIQWYLSRYYGLFKRMDFWPMVRLLGGIGLVVIVGGLLFDLIYNRVRRNP